MAINVTINTVGSLIDTTTAAATINNNFIALKAALLNAVALDGTAPNQMNASLDMNSHQILNLPAPGTAQSPVRLEDI